MQKWNEGKERERDNYESGIKEGRERGRIKEGEVKEEELREMN